MPYPEDYPVSPRQEAEYMAWLKDMEAARQVKEERGIYALRAPAPRGKYGPEAAERALDYALKILRAVSLAPFDMAERGVYDGGDGTTPIMAWAEAYCGPMEVRARGFVTPSGRVSAEIEAGTIGRRVAIDLTLQPEADHDLVAAILQAASVYSRQGLPR